MPAVTQARRGGGKARAPARGGRTRRRPAASGLSMKLGAWARAQVRAAQYSKDTRLTLIATAVAAAAALGALIAVASGATDHAARALQAAAAGAAKSAGLTVRQVSVQTPDGGPVSEARRAQVLAAVDTPRGVLMSDVDPAALKARVEEIAWVQDAQVLRLWPDQVVVIATPRRPAAVWQAGGRFAMIDAGGAVVSPFGAVAPAGFPLVVGEGAAAAAPTLFSALARQPAVAARTRAAVRVGDRRWTLVLASGASVLLPAEGADQALAALADLQRRHALLERPLARIDLRHRGVLILRPQAPPPDAPAAPATQDV